jgi:F0F1-type ATP synthase delta subunit
VELKLPITLVTRQDLIRVHRELQGFNDLSMQSVMRHDNPIKYPPISDNLRAIAVDNQIDLRHDKACQKLLDALDQLRSEAPIIRISFPADPSQEILQKLVTWLRKEIDPTIIIQVGLQPTIAAGIVLSTPNHQYDFSLRQHLYKNRDKLVEAL